MTSRIPLEKQEIPVLPGYINLTEAAERLGVSRQQMHRDAQDGRVKTLRRIGTQRSWVISIKEVEKKIAERSAPAESSSE